MGFEVVDFKIPYHCILGRPAFAKFMARPCYTYSKMKILGPKGPITVSGDIDKAIECENGCTEEADTVIAAEELEKMSLKVNPDDDTLLKQPTSDADSGTTFKSAQDTKTIDLVEGDSSKQAVIGANMDLT